MARKLSIGVLLLLFVVMCVLASSTLFDAVVGDIKSDEFPKQFVSFTAVSTILSLIVLMPFYFILTVNQEDNEDFLLRSRTRIVIFIVFAMAIVIAGGGGAVQMGQQYESELLKGIGVEILGAVFTVTLIVFLERYLNLLIDMSKGRLKSESKSTKDYEDLFNKEVNSYSVE